MVRILAADGTVMARYAYNAWGELTTCTGTLADVNPLRYRGYYYDTETGMYYLKSRYYDPKLCRFINADSTDNLGADGGFIGTNLFAYCLNNPVNNCDSEGSLAFFVATAIVGAAIGAVIGGINAAKNGGEVWKGVVKGALIGGAVGAGAGALTGVALAGSATATIASVATGASALSTTIGGAGKPHLSF